MSIRLMGMSCEPHIHRGISVVLADSKDLLAEEEKEELKEYLASNPEAGVIVKGTGGIRKLRWAASGRGNVVVVELSITSVTLTCPSAF